MRRHVLEIVAVLAVGVGAVLLLGALGGGDGGPNRRIDARAGDPGDTSTPPASGASISQIPGGPREDVPSALDDMNDPSFPEPLVDPSEIRSGGPPPDGIPAIDAPQFERVPDVDWLEDVEPVLVVELEGDARAYPVQIMTWHEIVNDTFASTPVTISYCPLCNSAIAYIREADGRVLDFGTSGRLLNSSLVMYDRQTESLWSHFTGQAIVGSLTGTILETIPVATTSWESFRTAHPDGLVLSRNTGFGRDYGRNPYPGYDDVDSQPFLFSGEVDGRLAAQTRVVVVRGETETIAVVQEDLADQGVLHTEVDGEPIVLWLQPGTASALDASSVAAGRDIGAVGVFRSRLGGRELTFERTDEGFFDLASGSTWNILGQAVAGELAGDVLDPIEHLDTFWFAIAAFEPHTRIVTG